MKKHMQGATMNNDKGQDGLPQIEALILDRSTCDRIADAVNAGTALESKIWLREICKLPRDLEARLKGKRDKAFIKRKAFLKKLFELGCMRRAVVRTGMVAREWRIPVNIADTNDNIIS